MPISREELIRTLIGQKTNIMAYVFFLVGNNEIAEDIFQNISILAYQKCDSINDEDHLMAWLRVAARNESLQTIRTQSRSRVRFDSNMIDQLEPYWEQFDHQDSKLQDRLLSCLKKLSPKAREMVKLRYYECVSGDIIARKLKISTNAVYVGLSRVHRNLAKCIQRKYTL